MSDSSADLSALVLAQQQEIERLQQCVEHQCETVVISSRMCEYGTKGCEVRHDKVAVLRSLLTVREEEIRRLTQYAQHLPGCIRSTTLAGDPTCSCGFTPPRFPDRREEEIRQLNKNEAKYCCVGAMNGCRCKS